MKKCYLWLQRAARATAGALAALVRELRDALRENGVASCGRWASWAIVGCWCYVLVVTRQIPERTEQAAILVAALYGANQLKLAVQQYGVIRQATQPMPPAAPAPPGQPLA